MSIYCIRTYRKTRSLKTVGLFLPHSVTDVLAQFPKSSIKDQNAAPLDITDSIYNANTSKFLGSKNISLTPTCKYC
ncbi:hypothetical protein BH18THE2_BH18THE2_36870 [soil metagenome]